MKLITRCIRLLRRPTYAEILRSVHARRRAEETEHNLVTLSSVPEE